MSNYRLVEYKTSQKDLAEIIAQMTSGFKNAVPEQDDYDLAGEVIHFIEEKLRE